MIQSSDDSNHQFETPITVNTILNDFIYKIDPPDSTEKYFSPDCGVDFNEFLKTLTTSQTRVSDIIYQKNYGAKTSSGQTYCKFMSGKVINGFENMNQMNYDNPVYYISTLIPHSIKSVFYKLFNMNSVEGATTKHSAASSKTFTSFFETDQYTSKLIALENDLRRRGINDYDGCAAFVESCINLGIHYSDYQSICTIFDQFNNGNVMQINELQQLLSLMESIGISNIDDIKSFINNIIKFGIKYKTNFNDFISKMQEFNMGSSLDIKSITVFLNDMNSIQITYATPEGTKNVNTIIQYFLNYKFTLIKYSSTAQLNFEACSTIPPKFCSKFVNAMHKYTDPTYFHSFYDIKTASLFNLIPYCDTIDAMQQAYIMCVGPQSQTIISQNILTIVSFFYQEELDAIVAKSKTYNNIENRVKMMHDIAKSMKTFATTLDQSSQQNTIMMYNSVANILTIFPAISFQYFSNLFISACSDGKCDAYSIYLDPNYTYAKASMTKKSINNRSIDAVV